MRMLLTALIAVLPAAAIARPITATEPWVDRRPAPRGEAELRSAMIAGHNRARVQYGVPPLAWNDALARDAAVYAAVMARSGRFQHDPQRGRAAKQGENLFFGTRSAYRFGEMVRLWVDERREYRGGRFPNVSVTGDWSRVGHYTQIIWPTTRMVGCATSSNRRNDYLVCRYWPAGNVVGTILR